MMTMPEFFLKLSLGLAVTYIFYYAVLRKHTFYTWNRWYLLIYSHLAMFIPMINVNTFVPHEQLAQNSIASQVPRISHYLPKAPIQSALPGPAPKQPLNWLLIIFLAGAAFMTCRFFLQLYFYSKIKRKAKLVADEDFSLYHVECEIVPFSFGKSIFVNPAMHAPDELEKILLHEYVHVQQNHTNDNIWAELLCILNWYNPFAWLIRYAIRQNLEYIADEQVLKNQVDAKAYQYLLLKVSGISAFPIGNQFNFAPLKRRIIMMNKHRTRKIFLIKFLLLVPLLMAMFVAFQPDMSAVKRLARTNVTQNFYGNPVTSAILDSLKNVDRFGYCAGLMLDAVTKKPLADFPLQLMFGEKVVKVIYTDKDGYYFAKVEPDSNVRDFVLFSLKPIHPEYNEYAVGAYASELSIGYGRLSVDFLSARKDSTVRGYHYSPQHKNYAKKADPDIVNRKSKEYLTTLLDSYLTDIQNRADFKKYHPFPKDVLTKFNNGYFDRRSELVGYEGVTKLYLDGKLATYEAINEAFRSSPYMLDDTRLAKEWGRDAVYAKLYYLSFPLYKDAPPQRILSSTNLQEINLSAFDVSVLATDAYFLDGFRQVPGIGSNLKPAKNEIRRVVLFKGQLARYYDPKLDKLWWIETRPANEVFGRPDFANK